MEKMILCILCLAAGGDFEKAVLTVSGAAEIEELSEDEMERYRSLAAHPLDLNAAGQGRLRSSGLFSPFQVESLIEYRESTGDILSWSELAMVSGFGEDLVEALKEFIRLESPRAPGQRERKRLDHEVCLRAAAKEELPPGKEPLPPPQANYGIKYALQWGEKAVLNWSTRTTYDNSSFKPGTISAAWYGRGRLAKVVAGDFSARFGQGLTSWTGFSLSGYTTVQAFRRNASGISPTTSFSSETKGAGAELHFGRWSVSAAYSFTDKTPIANVSRIGETASIGITATTEAASFDWMVSIPNWSFYGEAGWNGKPMALTGIVWIPQYGRKFAAICKYKGDKLTAAACAETKYIQASFQSDIDYAKQKETYKFILSSAPSFTLGSCTLTPSLRLSSRLKPQDSTPWRTDIRADIDAAFGSWLSHLRFNALLCRSFAWLCYAEEGYKDDRFAFYARGTIFFIDNWDDRIYVYERDAPGSFNVPAMYGRGFSASLVAALKFSRRHAIHARLSGTFHPWTSPQKSGRIEMKVQYTLRI